jgi:hypothetical protein
VATTKGARKGGSKGLKWCPCHIAVAVSNNGDDEEVGDSDEECVAATERDFKHQTRPPKDHFEKLLKAAYLSYPVPRKRERSLHTCAQDVQITRMVTI